ncbi:MAG: bifunctional riboflavin kinase/FAD synthetase [Deltaproteobacteria bacterium]|nr:bifunctional riboflavin kinase/FAD synthetase [Deltaproteobacteria bacterium]MBW2340137.1 bifunctional riboflavin kinase/FAD synthetase [Deltaproteobacteria bacterium]
MTLICTLDNLPDNTNNPVVTIGNFDGVHKGHLALFKKVRDRAMDLQGTSVVITFEPHPIKVMSPEKLRPLITILEQKKELVMGQGIDILLLIKFTLNFAGISARGFVKDILVDRIGIKEIVVGYDYAFGHNREGNIKLLREMGQEFEFTVHQVRSVYAGKTLVSSTSIRNLIVDGNLSEANRLLGRNYQIRGKVIEGRKRGESLLGYATANLRLPDGLIPREGVYIVTAELEGKLYQGLTNIGYNPTFKDKTLSVETHIFDFSANIVKQNIKVNFLSRLRDEIAFTTVEELSQQISRDIEQAREFFREQEKH